MNNASTVNKENNHKHETPMNPRKKRRAPMSYAGQGAILLLILILGLAWYFYTHYQSHLINTLPLPVETAVATEGPLERSLSAIGTLQANQSIIIRPEISGRITAILFKDGQSVIENQPLIVLENSIAMANVRESKADFILRQADFLRAQTLLTKGAGSVTDKDHALAKLEIAAASLEKSEINLEKMHLVAPFEGWVGLRKVSIGDFVSPGQELVNLVDLTPMKVDFRIPEKYLEKVKEGQTLEIVTHALPHQIFIGKIYAIDPQIDPIGHSLLIRGVIDNEKNILHPGLFVNIKIVLETLENVLFIPAEALMPQEQKQFVFKLENNTVTRTEVVVGERQQNQVEIVKGLKSGDIVITAGHMKLSEGTRVTPLASKHKNKSSIQTQEQTVSQRQSP